MESTVPKRNRKLRGRREFTGQAQQGWVRYIWTSWHSGDTWPSQAMKLLMEISLRDA